MNTRFIEILRQCKELHEKKSHDYASDADSQSNFKLVEKFASIFGDIPEKHRPYIYLLGTKYARLAELLKEGKVPKNESIADTFRDTIVYNGLWAVRIEEDSDTVRTDNKDYRTIPGQVNYCCGCCGRLFTTLLFKLCGTDKIFCSQICSDNYIPLL